MKPNVFPTDSNTNPPKVKVDSEYESERLKVADEIYSNASTNTGMSAIEEMHKRTADQIKLRDAQLEKNANQTQNYQAQFEQAKERPATTTIPIVDGSKTLLSASPSSPTKPQVINTPIDVSLPEDARKAYIDQISQPQWNMSFDVLPLPSQGKLYPSKKPTVKVAYLATIDENILSSPNLLQSGEFLEILINRKLLDTNLRYKDLHIGDRNAIMLWLRATSFGEMYPVTLLDEKDVPFDTEINLNDLKIKNLNVDPNAEGLFEFTLPMSKILVKFKLLTVGELEEVERMVEEDELNNIPVDNTPTYMLEKQIVEIDGNRNPEFIKSFLETLRYNDGNALKEYMSSIDCGVDLELTIGTPGGGSIKTFLPLNIKFFWPKLSV